MTQETEIADIERRAKAVGKPIYILCMESHLAPSSFYRWKSGAKATHNNLQAMRDRLAVLEKAQAKKAAAA